MLEQGWESLSVWHREHNFFTAMLHDFAPLALQVEIRPCNLDNVSFFLSFFPFSFFPFQINPSLCFKGFTHELMKVFVFPRGINATSPYPLGTDHNL